MTTLPTTLQPADRSERSRALQQDAGISLVEIVIAMLVLGVTISALLAALITGVRSSTAHRQMTTMDTALRTHAESIKVAVRTSCGAGTWSVAAPGGAYTVAPLTGSCPPLAGFQTITVTVSGPGGPRMMDISVRRP